MRINKTQLISATGLLTLLFASPVFADAHASQRFTGWGNYWPEPNLISVDVPIPPSRNMYTTTSTASDQFNYYYNRGISPTMESIMVEAGVCEWQRTSLGHTVSRADLYNAWSNNAPAPTYVTFYQMPSSYQGSRARVRWYIQSGQTHAEITTLKDNITRYASNVPISIPNFRAAQMGILSKPGTHSNGWQSFTNANYREKLSGIGKQYPPGGPNSNPPSLWTVYQTLTPENDGYGFYGQSQGWLYNNSANCLLRTYKNGVN